MIATAMQDPPKERRAMIDAVACKVRHGVPLWLIFWRSGLDWKTTVTAWEYRLGELAARRLP